MMPLHHKLVQLVCAMVCVSIQAHAFVCDGSDRKGVIRGECSDDTLKMVHSDWCLLNGVHGEGNPHLGLICLHFCLLSLSNRCRFTQQKQPELQ